MMLIVASCSGSMLPEASADRAGGAAGSESAGVGATLGDDGASSPEVDAPANIEPVATVDNEAEPEVVTINLDGPTAVFDRRLLGTNVPAWLGADRLLDREFQANAVASGTTLVRMPGGSWSNAYDWEGCERRDPDRCFWLFAARPSHYAEFMTDTDLPGMWTVSINHTAQSAAALVAFFNGEVGDTSFIGVDRNGVNWGNVDRWAQLRATGGHPEPVRIELWEIGNEVYGGTKDSGGSDCQSWGWETVWTCDGTAYVNGDDEHDGYLAIRAAMLAVDPTIEIGAVGVPTPGDWNDWGNEVIRAAGSEMDFYIVHQYGFQSSPGTVEALRRPTVMWSEVVSSVRRSLGNAMPIAVTEYNLVAVESLDDQRSMTQAINALYIAESIGQMSSHGVSIANQWNLANGTAGNGTDYGMVDANTGSRFPQFEALATWSRAGNRLLPVVKVDEGINVYPTLHHDGRVTLIVIGRASSDGTWSIDLAGLDGGSTVTTTVAAAADPTDTELSISTTTTDVVDSVIELTVPAWSISSVEVVPAANR